MPSLDRRAAGRRRAWGRGPIILKLESLERRALMAANAMLPDLVNSALATSNTVADWNDTVQVLGRITNQGTGTTTAPLHVAIYASPVRGVHRYAVPIGEVTIPAGITAGQSVPYQTSVQLPTTPLPNVDSTNGTLYLVAAVNPERTVTEGNYRNDRNIGPPYDATPLLIRPPAPAHLVGTTLAVTPSNPTWGGTVTVTAQITNQGSGPSPQTRAYLALTPQGLDYGGTTTVGVGNLIVPPLAPYQTVNLVQNLTLPAVEPLTIANYTNFGLTMTLDADYLTNDTYPHQPSQGIGYDQAAVTVTTGSDSTATTGTLPDLAASSVLAPTSTMRWGQSFQVTTDIQNLGQGDAGGFLVRYLLTGQTGTLIDALYLGDARVDGLASGAHQQVTQTLQLPIRLPSGVTLNSVGYARVVVMLDPENVINESLKSNDVALSAPFVVRLPGNATTVPTTQAAGVLPTVDQVAQKSRNEAKVQAALRRAAKHHARVASNSQKPKKLHRRTPPKTNSLVNKGVSLATELTKLPHQVFTAIKRSV